MALATRLAFHLLARRPGSRPTRVLDALTG
jgi:hypothetical protein